jgi:TRAP transporter TAXI family solute receptor
VSGSNQVSRRTVLVGLAAAAASAVGVAVARPLLWPDAVEPFVIAGGAPEETTYAFSRLLRRELSRAGVPCSVVGTTGTSESLAVVRRGTALVATAAADELADAMQADSATRPMGLARLYQSAVHCIVRDDSDIAIGADLRARSIAVGLAGSDGMATAARVLQALEIPLTLVGDPEDGSAMVRPMSAATGAKRLTAGLVDAMIWVGGLPPPEVRALGSLSRLRAVDLSDATAALELQLPGVFRPVRLAASIYSQERDVMSVGVGTHLVVGDAISDAAVRLIVDLMVTDPTALIPLPEAGLQFLVPGTLIDATPVDLHPAAAERYREFYG